MQKKPILDVLKCFNKSNSILQEFFPSLKFYIMTGEYACLCMNCILIILGVLATLRVRDAWYQQVGSSVLVQYGLNSVSLSAIKSLATQELQLFHVNVSTTEAFISLIFFSVNAGGGDTQFYLKMCYLSLSYYQRFVFRLIDCCFFLFAVGVEHSSWSGRLYVYCGASY